MNKGEKAMIKWCVGADMGGTTVKIGLLTTAGELVEKWEIPTRKENEGAQVLPDIAASILAKFEEKNIDKAEVAGVGIGVPGPVDSDGFVPVCVNIGWRDGFYPARALSELLGGMKVKAGNDANVAALGEAWMGGAKGSDNAMFMTLGTGVGGGVILNGQIVTGCNGLGGEVGHMPMIMEEPDACNCGNHGCLEQYASATGIVKEAKRALLRTDAPSVLREKEDFSCKDIWDAAKSGDTVAVETVDYCMKILALAMSHITHTVDPNNFVIGGGVSAAGEYLVELVRKHYAEFTPLLKVKPEISLATLGNDAGTYGAAKLILGE